MSDEKEKKTPREIDGAEKKMADEAKINKAPSNPMEPERQPLAVTSRQFVKAKGLRWERSAGFLHFAGTKYGERHRLSVAEWNKIWDAWWKQPAGQPVKREV